MSDTSKVWQVGKAPKYLKLEGDKTQKIESAYHIIEAPGASIEVARCDDGTYWLHIAVNHGQVIDDTEGRVSARGEIISSRIDYDTGITEVPNAAQVEHIAIRIKAMR